MQFSRTNGCAVKRQAPSLNRRRPNPERSSMGLVNGKLSGFFGTKELKYFARHERASEDGALPRRGQRYTRTCNSVGGGC